VTYNDSYPKKRIGKGNPYMMCALCKKSEPEINGDVRNHAEWCSWRKQQELKHKPIK